MSELEKNNKQQPNQPDQLKGREAASEVDNYSKKLITKVAERHDGLMDRLFPDKLQQAKVKGDLDLMETEYAAAKRFVQIMREAQEQSFTEACNEGLSKDKAESRKNIASDLFQKREELQQETENYTESFLQQMDEKLNQIEQFRNTKIKEKRRQQLERDIDEFMETQAEIMEQFRKILFERISLG